MKISILQTGSDGNATVVEAGGSTLIFDAGISYRRLVQLYGCAPQAEALFISHSHTDHIRHAERIHKLAKHVHLTEPTRLRGASFLNGIPVVPITDAETVEYPGCKVTVFPTQHDAPGSVGFVVEETDTGKSFSMITDTGMLTEKIKHATRGSHAYFFESDYDEQGLIDYPHYPTHLKNRIKGNYGHLSTQTVIGHIKEHIDLDSVEWIVFGHLSKKTNSKALLQSHLNKAFREHELSKFHISSEPLFLKL